MARHKYNAVRTDYNGRNYGSKLEAAYAVRLDQRVAAGEVVFYLWQVPFHLPGGVRYVVDFQEFHADGTVHFIDVKGMVTPTFTMKKKMVEDLYPVEIEVVKK